jgi:hypothetical protein
MCVLKYIEIHLRFQFKGVVEKKDISRKTQIT